MPLLSSTTGKCLSALFAFLFFMAAPAAAQSTITVDEDGDDVNGNGSCSIREAVQSANTNTAVGGCVAGTGEDTITFALASGTTIILDGGELLLSEGVTVNGEDLGITIDAQSNSRIFDVQSGGDNVAFASLTLTNGNASVNSSAPDAGGAVDIKSGNAVGFADVNVTDSQAGLNGGGIHAAGDTGVEIEGGNITGNTANEGGGVWSAGAVTIDDGTLIDSNVATGGTDGPDSDDRLDGGGGVYMQGGDSSLQIGTGIFGSSVTISNNTATGGSTSSGGGILNNGGRLRLQDSEISGNTANRAGGGVESNGGLSSSMVDMTITDNTATGDGDAEGNGGGIHVTGRSFNIDSGMISENTAVEGGGIWADNLLVVEDDEGQMDMTVIDNEATGDAVGQGGGGIYIATGGEATISDALISGNAATGTQGSGGGLLNNGENTVSIGSNTLISNNTANRAGGGIENFRGVVSVNGSDITGNVATGDGPAAGNGGGVHSGGPFGNRVTIGNTDVTENTAVEGGGIWAARTLNIELSRVDDNVATGALADQGGGGIYVNGATGSARIRNTDIRRNSATGELGSGGGVFNNGGELNMISGSRLLRNTANRAGGGIEAVDGSVTLRATTLRRNAVASVDDEFGFDNSVTPNPGNGGGLHVTGGTEVEFRRSTVAFNQAVEGGGVWISGAGSLNMANSTVSQNVTTTGDGGGVYDDGDDAVVTLTSSTIVRNEAGGNGGGLLSQTDGQFEFGNTIVASNTADGTGNDCSGTFTSNDYNLIEDTDGCTITGNTDNNITGEDPALGELMAANGGRTRIHLPGAFSPVIDAGNSLGGANTDQRGQGFPRTVDNPNADNAANGTDIGSVEAPADTPIPVQLASFNVVPGDENRSAVLSWKTETETNNSGFRIEQQSGENGPWREVYFVPSQVESGNSSQTLSYQETLSGLEYGKHTFRLVQVDRDNDETTYGGRTEQSVEIGLSEAFALSEAYPNPVRSGQPATVDLTVREAQDVDVVLYDALGRQVRTVHSGAVDGQRTLSVRVQAGDLASGTYLLRAKGERFSATRKLVVVR